MTHEVKTHRDAGSINEMIRVERLGDTGPGGACQEYRIVLEYGGSHPTWKIRFLSDFVNPDGITMEALLAVVADRLECFQEGPFSDRYNERALEHVQQAMAMLRRRHLDRRDRGVEGKLLP